MTTTPVKPQRTLLQRSATFASREAVYETPDGLDLESNDQYEVTARRVLWEDVLLVTYHREVGTSFMLVNGLWAAFWLVMGGVVLIQDAELSIAIMFAVIGGPSLIAIIVRAILKVDVVSVFGRRSKAQLRFTFRKAKARATYGHICARVRQAHRELEASIAAEEAASQPAPEYELPPPSPAAE